MKMKNYKIVGEITISQGEGLNRNRKGQLLVIIHENLHNSTFCKSIGQGIEPQGKGGWGWGSSWIFNTKLIKTNYKGWLFLSPPSSSVLCLYEQPNLKLKL